MKSSVKQTILIISVTGIALLGSVGSLTVLLKSPHYGTKSPAPEQSVTTSAARPAVTISLESLKYDQKLLAEKVARECPGNELPCFKKALLEITERHGPGASLSVLQKLEEQKRISAAADRHRIAREIGGTTASRFGINDPAFLLCPTSMNDDCRHGFFQYALGQAHATDNVARLICGSLDRAYSAKFIFDCYLGLGHGVLIAQNYDLTKALDACETLGTPTGQDGCRQGAFIENRNASLTGSGRRDVFSRNDPLAPCNIVPDKYRYACFINHAGRLMEFFNNNVKKAARACLKAPDAYVSPCLQSIGLMVSNGPWQRLLAKNNDGKSEVIAWDLCLKFPQDHREPCVIGALDTFLNFDAFEVARAKAFCNAIDTAYRPVCYHRMGFALRTQAVDPSLVRAKCETLTGEGAAACLQGAAMETSAPAGLATKAPIDAGVLKTEKENIFNNDVALYAYVKRFGLGPTITHLHALASRYGDCHVPAHKAGRFAYSIFSMKTFRAIPGECHAGGFHGAVEAYFKERGAAHLANDVKVICGSELNAFNTHQCMHGIGHGLMAAANYELPQALETCNQLKDWQSSCWTGAFMENIVGGLGAHAGHVGHATKYLNDDPHYPCTIVDTQYKSSCYFLQASRMVQLFGPNFGRISATCAQAPAEQREICFDSMGREVGGLYRGRPAEAIQACGHAEEGEFRIDCLTGAVQDTFWDSSGQGDAREFCKLLNAKAEKDACYKMIFGRAPQILSSQREMQSFCDKVEAEYRRSCLKKPKVST
ncbi:MAG TPA: hypothetical protein VGJ57_04620 [Nitrospirales bacterium]|jgi:hypothetical protein